MTIRLLQTLQDAPSTKQMLTDGQDTIKTPPKTLGHKLYQMVQNAPNAKQTITDTNNHLQKMLLTRLAPSR